MADVDEDVVRSAHGEAGEEDADEDETQDFRFLSNLANLANQSSSGALPARGIKDFEPHATNLQASNLDASRKAMHDALSHTRLHLPKNHVRGVYDSSTGLTTVRNVKGNLFRTVGKPVSGGGMELLPEEALWALERGSLDIIWGIDSNADGDDDEEGDIPMSLQAAYAALLGEEQVRRGWLTLEKYLVYAGLKRGGFIVTRASETDFFDSTVDNSAPDSSAIETKQRTIFTWLHELVAHRRRYFEAENSPHGPLVKPGLYRSYDEIYRLLALHPATTSAAVDSKATPGSPYTTTFNIYKPVPSWRKSNPGEPSFRVCVVSARETSLPTLSELSCLLNEQPASPPKSKPGENGIGGMYARLKHGQRNVLLAVVDEGIVSYSRVSEAGFVDEKLWQMQSGGQKGGKGGNRGGKRGGRGGRGGRGK